MFENVKPKDLNIPAANQSSTPAFSPSNQPTPPPAFPTPERPAAPLSDPFSRSVPQAPKPKIKTTGKMSSVAWLVIILLIIGVVGGGAFGAYWWFNNTPDKIFDTAVDNLEKLQSGTVVYNIAITGHSKSDTKPSIIPFGQDLTFSVNLETTFNKTADGFYQNQTKTTVNIPTGANLPFLGSVSFSPEIHYVMVDKTEFYLKVLGIPTSLFGLDGINNQWMLVNFDDLSQEFGLKMNATSSTPEKTKVQIETLKTVTKKLYRQHRFLVLKNAGSEVVSGTDSYHYTVTLDKAALKAFLLALDQDQTLNELFKEYSSKPITPEQIDKALAVFDINGDLWIAKKTKVFTKVTIRVPLENEEGSGSVTLDVNLPSYNQPVTITAPTDALPLKQVIDRITGAGLARSKNLKVVADVKQIQTALELYYNDHTEYPVPFAGGNRLGVDAKCLGSDGFAATEMCPSPYMALVPTHPDSPSYDYQYFRCSAGHYIISFYLPESNEGLSAGLNFGTENGISNAVVGDDCRPLPDEANNVSPVDTDGDGLSDIQEAQYGTNPNNPDTDGDSYLDGAEVQNGYNPNGPGQLVQ